MPKKSRPPNPTTIDVSQPETSSSISLKKNKQGKARRGDKVAERTQIRLDPDAKEALRREFGSIGNACYYLYQGIEQIKENHNLPSQVHNPPTLTAPELDVIMYALRRYFDHKDTSGTTPGTGGGGGRVRQAIMAIMFKINNARQPL